MALILIPPRDIATGTYTRKTVVQADQDATPVIYRVIASSNVQIGFAFATTGGAALCGGAVLWGHPQGGTLEIDGAGEALVVGEPGKGIDVENRTSGWLTILVGA